MKTVAQLLQSKPHGVIAISPGAAVLDAVKLLAENGVGSVLVMEGNRLLGIVSERDYARKLILMGKSSANTLVSEVMTQEVFVVTPAHTNVDCMVLMNEKRIRHLPVIENDQVVGVLSIRDLLKDMIAEQQNAIDQLTDYTDPGE
jgi:CBS domain-containing protein